MCVMHGFGVRCPPLGVIPMTYFYSGEYRGRTCKAVTLVRFPSGCRRQLSARLSKLRLRKERGSNPQGFSAHLFSKQAPSPAIGLSFQKEQGGCYRLPGPCETADVYWPPASVQEAKDLTSSVPVQSGGVEPPRAFAHSDLNAARLPFRHDCFCYLEGISAEVLGCYFTSSE